MSDDGVNAGADVQAMLQCRVMHLNAVVLGIVLGLVAGGGLFIVTNWLVLKDGPEAGPHLALLGQFFIGYRVSFIGSLIGFVYAFICAGLVGYCGASIYNIIARLRGDNAAEAKG